MVGCGAVAETKSGPAYSRVAGSRLVAVASRRVSAARTYATRHCIEHVFETPDELISSPHVDAVYIATPPSSHLALAMRVAEAGKPCCVEKPLSMSYPEAMEMMRAFQAAGPTTLRCPLPPLSPSLRTFETLDCIGAIGDVRHIHWTLARSPKSAGVSAGGDWRTDCKEAPGGYFEDLACHGLDLFDFFVGPISLASGVKANQQGFNAVPDAVAACWSHACGATGSGL